MATAQTPMKNMRLQAELTGTTRQETRFQITDLSKFGAVHPLRFVGGRDGMEGRGAGGRPLAQTQRAVHLVDSDTKQNIYFQPV